MAPDAPPDQTLDPSLAVRGVGLDLQFSKRGARWLQQPRAGRS